MKDAGNTGKEDTMIQNPVNVNGLQWMVRGNTFMTCGRTMPRLPPGAYTVGVDYNGNAVFTSRALQADDIIDFDDSLGHKVLEEIDRFWKLATASASTASCIAEATCSTASRAAANRRWST